MPDVLEAVEFLTADLSGPFARVPGCQDRLLDRRNQVNVDLLPAGKCFARAARCHFRCPAKVAETPQIIGLADLISLKLDSWNASPSRRLKDKADVVELIKQRNLPRDVAIATSVRHLYVETWDALKADI